MSGNQTFPITKPSLYDVLQQLKEEIFSTLRVCVPAEVVSFDGTKRTASVQILLKRVLANGDLTDYKPLNDCPVYTPGAGDAFLQFPIAAGDQGLLIFADRNIGGWIANGGVNPMPDLRAHDISDGIFIPGLNPYNDAMPAYPTDGVLLTYHGTSLKLTATGLKLIGAGGAEIDFDTLVGIKNNTTSLLIAINTLITAIEGIQVQGNLPLTAPSITALEAAKLVFAGLLE